MNYELAVGAGTVFEAAPAPGADGRRLGRLATSDAEVNIRLLSRLAETAITSGDVKTAVEAVRACTAEAEHLYQIAVAERGAATAVTRAAAEERARALAMQDAAAAQYDRAVAAQADATAHHARAVMMQTEAAALHARAVSMRDAADEAMAEVEAQRKADRDRKRAGSVPRRLRVTDINGLDLRPDPSTATTPAEYIEVLGQFRLWAGNPSFRELEKRVNDLGRRRPVASTICKVLQGDELPPRFDVIEAIILACGAIEEDKQRFATAWRRLVLPERRARSVLHVVPDPGPA